MEEKEEKEEKEEQEEEEGKMKTQKRCLRDCFSRPNFNNCQANLHGIFSRCIIKGFQVLKIGFEAYVWVKRSLHRNHLSNQRGVLKWKG